MKKANCLLSALFLFSGCTIEGPDHNPKKETKTPYKMLAPSNVWVLKSKIYRNRNGAKPKFPCIVELEIAEDDNLIVRRIMVNAYNIRISINKFDDNVMAALNPADQGIGGSPIGFNRAEISVPSKELLDKWLDAINDCKKQVKENAPYPIP